MAQLRARNPAAILRMRGSGFVSTAPNAAKSTTGDGGSSSAKLRGVSVTRAPRTSSHDLAEHGAYGIGFAGRIDGDLESAAGGRFDFLQRLVTFKFVQW